MLPRLRPWLFAVVLLGCASCGTTAAVIALPEAAPPVKVELDVFSGRPNPAWTLSDDDRRHLQQRLEALPDAEPAELESNLGYRGFVVRMAPSESGLVTVQRGIVHVSGEGYYRDEDRELERWLLDTGESEMEPEIADLVEDELT